MEIASALTGELEPVHTLVERVAATGVECRPAADRLQIWHRPLVAPEAYAITLFEGVDDATIERYEEIHTVQIPSHYRRLLLQLNGGSLFRLDLYGLPPSMTKEPPTLDRTQIQPLDLATANKYWATGFTSQRSLFHFGSGPWSTSENVGYFLSPDGTALALRKADQRVASWRSVQDLLEEEIRRAEEAYSDFEKLMESFRS